MEETKINKIFMEEALRLATKAGKRDEVPIGAVIEKDGKIIAKAYNTREKSHDATAHAEILAIKKACKKVKDFRLVGCSIYVTLEPCIMCMGAILNARIDNLYFGAYASKEGALSSEEINQRAKVNHQTNIVGGIMKAECKKLITDYFRSKR
jgi:tRNA(adenine34) deaminase